MKNTALLLALLAAPAAAGPQLRAKDCVALRGTYLSAPAAQAVIAARGKTGVGVALSFNDAGVTFDLGGGRSAMLGAYLTNACVIGLKFTVGGSSLSTWDLTQAGTYFNNDLSRAAPGWGLRTEMNGDVPSRFVATDGKVELSATLDDVFQADFQSLPTFSIAGKPLRLNYGVWGPLELARGPGGDVIQLHLAPAPEDDELAGFGKPAYALFDLKAYGLPSVIVAFEQRQGRLWELAP